MTYEGGANGYEGGANGFGIIFSYDPAGIGFQKRYDFVNTVANPNGANPFGSLIQGTDGLLYGLAFQGGINNQGAVFSFNPTDGSYLNIHSFLNTTGSLFGRGPAGSLIQAANGKLFGMTSKGGTNSIGTIFSMETNGAGFSVIRQLAIVDGHTPYGSLFELSNGDIAGMPNYGGDGGNGTVFTMSGTGTNFTKIHDFNFFEGAYPRGSLMQAKNKLLYGLTNGGGDNGQGTIFSYDLTGPVFNKLHSFQNSPGNANGANPSGSLVETAGGKLFGMTYAGGINNEGIIFSTESNGSGFTKLYDLNVANGARPYGSLTLGNNGLLYGMTSKGGVNNFGVLFSFNPTGNVFTKLHEFNNTDGALPRGNLLLASDGLLYGMTAEGGTNSLGVIFTFNPSNGNFATIHNFVNTGLLLNGAKPFGSLVEDDKGILYGLCSEGGTNNLGIIFSFNPKTPEFINLKSFENSAGILDGQNPFGSLTLGSNGFLYGMTKSGGANNLGTLFSFNPTGNAFSKLQDFNQLNGASPLYGDLLEPGKCRPPVVVCPQDITVTTVGDACTAAVPFAATLADFCPATIKYYLNFGLPTETEIVSGNVFNVGTFVVTAVAKDIRNYQSTCNFTIIVKSGKTEICGNNIDDNCDGQVDENCPPVVLPEIKISNAFVVEGNSGTRNATFTLWLNKKSATEVSVQYQTNDVSAVAPADYVAKSGTVIFPANSLLQVITVQVNGDLLNESNENFRVSLALPVNATLGNSFGTGIIFDDDREPSIRIDDASATESSQLAQVKVYLTAASGQIVKVKYETKDKSAKSPEDYTAVNGQITFQPGETVKYINVVIKQDNLNEKTEEFEVRLKDADNATLENRWGDRKEAEVKIINSISSSINSTSNNQGMLMTDQQLNLQVKVLPNPSANYFQLNINSNGKGVIRLRVTDMLGRVVEDRKNEGKSQQIKLGENWRYGNYIMELTQGDERKTIQLVKLR